MANVRFYRLGNLPNYANARHQGVFVHLIPTEGETHKAGLWFGGANDWEYLTNDTNAINAAIDAKIQGLDVEGYAQATITPNMSVADGKPNSTLTILGIQEVDGKISNDSSKNFGVAIDGVYDETNNKIATQDTVTNAINGLNAETIQLFTTATENSNTTLTFNGIKEVNGIITQDGTNPSTFTVGDAKLKIQIGSDTATDVFSANAIENSTIELDGNVFKKDGNVFSIYTTEGVSSTNPLVTQKDIASLGGAMHYKGTVSSLQDFEKIITNTDSDSDAEEAGNVYIATGNFTHDNNVISTGDMIVFNSPTNYNVIQSNITLGTGSGQIAANSAALLKDKLVVASGTGIETIDFDKTNLTDTTEKNKRTLNIDTGNMEDNGFYHAVTITDTFKVIGKDFSKSIDIKSNNRSIDIKNDNNTGVVVDLVWNTTIE